MPSPNKIKGKVSISLNFFTVQRVLHVHKAALCEVV